MSQRAPLTRQGPRPDDGTIAVHLNPSPRGSAGVQNDDRFEGCGGRASAKRRQASRTSGHRDRVDQRHKISLRKLRADHSSGTLSRRGSISHDRNLASRPRTYLIRKAGPRVRAARLSMAIRACLQLVAGHVWPRITRRRRPPLGMRARPAELTTHSPRCGCRHTESPLRENPCSV